MNLNYTEPHINLYNPIVTTERWKYVTSNSVKDVIPGAYLISSYGRCYSNLSNKFMKPLINFYGYIEYYFQITDKDKKRSRNLAHRDVAIEFNPVPGYENLDINHLDGNKANPCLWNLEWTTESRNIKHVIENGLNPIQRGEDSPSAKITEEQAHQICQLIISPEHLSDGQIAKIVNCDKYIVSNIRYGNSWRAISFKYGIVDKPNLNKARILFTNEDIHKICKYFEDNKYNYFSMTDLFKRLLKDVYNLDESYLESVRKTLTRYFKREAKKEICDLYDY